MELSKEQKELTSIIAKILPDKDDFVCVMLELHVHNKTDKMLKWIKDNPKATRDDVFDYLDKIAA